MTTPGTLAPSRVLPSNSDASSSAERVLVAAARRFANYGFAGTSIRDIAADLGINSATLYSHFASKGDILRELVRIGHQELDKQISEAVQKVQNEDPATRLRALVEADARVHLQYLELARINTFELHVLEPEAAAEAAAIRQRWRNHALEILDEGIATGQFTEVDPRLAVRAASDIVRAIPRWYNPELGGAEEIARRYGDFAVRLVGGIEE